MYCFVKLTNLSSIYIDKEEPPLKSDDKMFVGLVVEVI